MGKKTARLAGLAALAGLAYANRDKLFGSKDKGKSETKSEDNDVATHGSSYTPGRSNETARQGVGNATNDPVVKTRSISAPAPVATSDRNENYGNEGRRSAMGSSASPTYMSKTPGGDAKRTEGNQPMPSLRAVESRAASNKTDAMRNASRANVAGANRQKAMRANPEAQAAERVYPEELLVGGPGVKVVGAAAKNLANRGGKEVVEYSTPRLAAPAKQLTGPSKADLMARDRAARETARQEQMLKENASNYGLNPSAPGYDAAASSLRRNIGGDDFTIMKKGGMTKMASGGMTASRRGDGIASRGKTRGKIC